LHCFFFACADAAKQDEFLAQQGLCRPHRLGALQQAVKNTLQFISGEFTLRDVEKQIQATDSALAAKIKRPSLSSALKRLASEKEIVLVTAGSGKRASKYRRAG